MNKAIIVGKLSADATTKEINNQWLIKFSIPTTEYYMKDGVKGEDTTWHNIDFWTKSNKIAEHLVKGAVVSVNGSIKISEKDGTKFISIQTRDVNIEQFVKKQEADEPKTTSEPHPKYGDAPETDLPF